MHYSYIGMVHGSHGQQERFRSFLDPTIGQQSTVSDTRDSPYDSLCLTCGHDPFLVLMYLCVGIDPDILDSCLAVHLVFLVHFEFLMCISLGRLRYIRIVAL